MDIEKRIEALETSVDLLRSQLVNLSAQISSLDLRTQGQIMIGPSIVPHAQQIPLHFPEAMEKEVQEKFRELAKELKYLGSKNNDIIK